MENEMSASQLKESYESKVGYLRDLGREWSLTDEEIDEIFARAFEASVDRSGMSGPSSGQVTDMEEEFRTAPVWKKRKLPCFTKCLSAIVWVTFLMICALACLYFLISCHTATKMLVTRHIQGLIYPCMRTLRFLSLPLIERYQTLTDWHVEECLIENPFYQNPELDCWPCEQVRVVTDLSGFSNFTDYYYHGGVPFLVTDADTTRVDFQTLKQLYVNNSHALDKGTAKFKSNQLSVRSLKDLFISEAGQEQLKRRDLQITWRVNRVSAAQVVREIFRRPYFVPNNTEVAVQRFIFIDGLDATPYDLPLVDFANVWMSQGIGSRLIVLIPADQCRQICTTVSVVLNPKQVLFYNWQFWRPRSLPSGEDSLSITYLGSFY